MKAKAPGVCVSGPGHTMPVGRPRKGELEEASCRMESVGFILGDEKEEDPLACECPLPDACVEQKNPGGCALLNAYQEGKPGRRKPHHLTTGAAAASVSPEAPLL